MFKFFFTYLDLCISSFENNSMGESSKSLNLEIQVLELAQCLQIYYNFKFQLSSVLINWKKNQRSH